MPNQLTTSGLTVGSGSITDIQNFPSSYKTLTLLGTISGISYPSIEVGQDYVLPSISVGSWKAYRMKSSYSQDSATLPSSGRYAVYDNRGKSAPSSLDLYTLDFASGGAGLGLFNTEEYCYLFYFRLS